MWLTVFPLTSGGHGLTATEGSPHPRQGPFLTNRLLFMWEGHGGLLGCSFGKGFLKWVLSNQRWQHQRRAQLAGEENWEGVPSGVL